MRDSLLPSNLRNYLSGVLALLVVAGIIILLATAVFTGRPNTPTRAEVIFGPMTDVSVVVEDEEQPADTQIQFSFRLETDSLELNGDGRNVVNNCCLIMTEDFNGTGFILEPNQLVTADHVVENLNVSDLVEVRCAREEQGNPPVWRGQIIMREPEFDVAVIQILDRTDLSHRPLFLQTELPERLGELHLYGFEVPDRERPRLVAGVHRGTSLIALAEIESTDLANRGQVALLSGLAAHGNSGGPVFNDYGEVVGMTVVIYEATSWTVMIPAFTIESLLLFNGLIPEPEDE